MFYDILTSLINLVDDLKAYLLTCAYSRMQPRMISRKESLKLRDTQLCTSNLHPVTCCNMKAIEQKRTLLSLSRRIGITQSNQTLQHLKNHPGMSCRKVSLSLPASILMTPFPFFHQVKMFISCL